MDKPFSIAERIKSFSHAFNGIFVMLQSQHNAWIHALASILICTAGFSFGLNRSEWCWIVLAIISVWTAEALNTAFEFLADAASPEYHPLVKKAKDVAAGAVLITAIGAAVIGVLVIGPYVLKICGVV
ncbi:MAG: diacylglycerol kinase family protein [bacterium]